jgi:hypothetical protein
MMPRKQLTSDEEDSILDKVASRQRNKNDSSVYVVQYSNSNEEEDVEEDWQCD